MNTDQKDRLLKLAENNPDLAKDVVDILKSESAAPEAPVAVKIVKDEADKIEITGEQKKEAKVGIALFMVSALFIIGAIIYGATNISMGNTPDAPIFIMMIVLGILSSFAANILIAKSIGFPAFKLMISKHFKFI